MAILQYRAEQERTSISGVLANELDGIASALADELSAVIPAFAAAVTWPEIETAQFPC
ncbi:MAG: hypothetical protein ACXW5U_01240 [Thermoanaerobaculia bacterium]